MLNENLELLQWLYVVIVSPILGGIGWWVRGWWIKRSSVKRRRDRIIKDLSGLPFEAKMVLVTFYLECTHTLRGNPSDPATRLLISNDYIKIRVGGGSYDAIDSYLTIAPIIWECMDAWVAEDAASISRILEDLSKKNNHE